MRIIAVDDEEIALESLASAIKAIVTDDEVVSFRYAEDALEYAKENDIEVITLEVRKENDHAISLYEKLGFEKVGERPGYYSHPTDDAVLMNYSV